MGETNVERCFVLVWWNRIVCGSLLMLRSTYMYWLSLSMAQIGDYFRNLYLLGVRRSGWEDDREALTRTGQAGHCCAMGKGSRFLGFSGSLNGHKQWKQDGNGAD